MPRWNRSKLPPTPLFSGRSSRSCGPCRNLALSAALAAALLSACLGSRARDDVFSAADEISKQFDARAAALERGKIDEYLAPLSEAARTFEAPIAEGAARLGGLDLDLRFLQNRVADRTRLLGMKVGFTYRYPGLPRDNIFTVPLSYDLVRVGKRWTVTASSVLEEGRLPAWVQPVSKSESQHFFALSRPDAPRVAESLRLAEQARGKLQAKITFELEPKYVILFARNRAEYEEMTARASPVSAIAQAETSYEVTTSSIKVESRQIVVNLEKLFADGSALETFQHELGHLALAAETRPFTPSWVGESAAMYLADTRPAALWRAGSRAGRFSSISFRDLTRSTTLGAHDPTGVAATYEYAYSAAAAYYLIETFGADTYWEFYRSYSRVPAGKLYESLPEGTIASENEEAVVNLAVKTTGESLKTYFDLDEPELDQRVRAWIRTAA